MKRTVGFINGALGSLLVLSSCGPMGQQQAGQAGGAIGALAGAAGLSAVAHHQGARGGNLVAPALVGGIGGYAVGNQVGQSTGLQGVYKTEVPRE